MRFRIGKALISLATAFAAVIPDHASAQDSAVRGTGSVGQDYQWVRSVSGDQAGWGVDLNASLMISSAWSVGAGVRWFDFGGSTGGAEITSLFAEVRYYMGEPTILGLDWRFFTGGRAGYLHTNDDRLARSGSGRN